MRAVVVDRFMEPSELRVSHVPDPEPGPGEVCIDVHAAACNFYDTLIIRGRYQVRPDFPFVPGGEFAGVVCATGSDVRGFEIGDRVFGQALTGAYAERMVLPQSAVRALPAAVGFDQACVLPIAYGTSYAALVPRARLEKGETLLVHAAAGGVGLAAVQIGKALGARVIGTAGGAEKCEWVLRAGADHAIDYRAQDFVARVEEITRGAGADVIYDSVGGDTFDRSLRCIAWNGRLVVIGFSSGEIPTLKVNRVLLKNVSLVGLHWSAYPEREPEALDPIYKSLVAWLEQGLLEPIIYRSYSLEQLPRALEALASRKTHGKIIVKPRECGS